MSNEYVPKLLGYLRSLDSSIKDTKDLLPRTQNTLQTYGLSEVIATYEIARNRIFFLFPEIRKQYEGNLESQVIGER